MRKIESYFNPDEVNARVTELRESGVMEEAITIVAKPGMYDDLFKLYKLDKMLEKSSTRDKFASFFGSQGPESRVVNKLDLTEDESERYKKKLAEGAILLYVNDYEAHDGHLGHVPKVTGGSNFTSEKIYEGNE